jgi:hypothetical protein
MSLEAVIKICLHYREVCFLLFVLLVRVYSLYELLKVNNW